MAITDPKLAVSAALAEVMAAVQDAIALRQGKSTPPPPAAVTAALNRMSSAVAALNSAVSALSASGVPTTVQEAQTQALNTAIQSALALWQTTITQLRQAGVSGI